MLINMLYQKRFLFLTIIIFKSLNRELGGFKSLDINPDNRFDRAKVHIFAGMAKFQRYFFVELGAEQY